jgi:ABC-type glycerol-3-phosphate transport system substrate-binding protein
MADTPAGKLLNQQITRFAQENPGVKIQVRVKTQSGPGGLLESLSAASAAAPAAVPSLVALSRADLETAALKGLVFPLDALGDLAADADWYPYAQRLGQVQGTSFGLPFGGDALVLVYRPARMGPAPTDWNGVLRLAQPVVFPAADPQGLTTLSLYASLGGTLEDEQRRPALQADVLARALKLYADGGQQGVFPFWLSQVQTDDQAWQAYRDQRAQWLVTWASRYLSQLPPDSSAAPMPSLGDKPLTISTGWVWAVTEPEPEQQAAAARLAQHLAQPEFLGKWNEALGLLPVRPSTLNAWGDSSLRALLSQVVSSAQLRPSNDLFASIGPALEGATVQVIKRDSDPGQAAADAADRLAIPINK